MGQVGDSRLRSFLFAWLVLPALLHWGIAAGAQDHAGHNSAARTMSHGDHQMTPEMISVMRERIPRYRELSDQEIALNMKMMEGNKSRYLSPDKMHADAGLLVLIHGFGETGDRIMREAVQPMAGIFPAAMSAGMSMMDSAHIQKSVDDLENAGVTKLIVVPMSSSRRNTLMYQWQYIFALRDQGAYYDVPQVKTDARVIVTDPPAGHPLITRILLDHALEISTDPPSESVFVVAHGPVFEEENQAQLKVMAGQANRIRELGGFAEVEGITLQDDAAADVRAGNVARLRGKIEDAVARGKRALVVTDLLAARSIQWKIERDLAGLDYTFSVKGISMHPDFTRWFQETVSDALQQ